MDENSNKLQAGKATRWNSQLYMIKSMLKMSEGKLDKLEYTFMREN